MKSSLLVAFVVLAIPCFADTGFSDEFLQLLPLDQEQLSSDKAIANWQPAIELAMQNQLIEDMQRLAELGADVNAVDRDGRTPLLIAAREFPTAAFALLSAGADVFHTDQRGCSALHYASAESGPGRSDLVKALLDRGVDIDQRDIDGMTPLLFAAVSGNGEALTILMEGGADPTRKQDCFGDTALHLLAEAGGCPEASILMVPPLIDIPNKYGRTPLMTAAYWPESESLALRLLEAGADSLKKDRRGQTALHHACRSGKVALVKALLAKGLSVNGRTDNETTPLMEAANGGHVDVISTLLGAGADINLSNHKGRTALMLAIRYLDDESCALFLLEHGADPCHIDRKGWSVLHFASERDFCSLITALLDRGAAINGRNREGKTPLLCAAKSKYSGGALALLLEKGADPNLVDNGGRTPLHVIEGPVERALLAAQVDLDSADEFGTTPLWHVALGSEWLALELLEAGADPCTQSAYDGATVLHRACGLGQNDQLVEALLTANVDIDAQDFNGETPLLYCAGVRWGSALARKLLDAGANPHLVNHDGQSALHFACAWGCKLLVEALLEHDVAPDQLDQAGRAPLHWAIMSHYPTSDISMKLIEAGANIHLADHEGKTPLILAADAWHGESLALTLLDAGANAQQRDHEGLTALDYAKRREHVELVARLEEKETDQEVKGESASI